MVGVIFGQIGGQELLNYSMTELSGNENSKPIKDISIINERYSPYNILTMGNSASKTASQFDIKLSDYLVETGDVVFVSGIGTYGRVEVSNPDVYIDSSWENIVITLDDSAEGLLLEVDFIRFGDTF